MMDCTYNRDLDRWEGEDADELRYQIARIAGLKNYPREIAAVRELIRVLALCDNRAHMYRVIDELAESATECPSPARLRAVVYEKKEKARRKRCPICSGEGVRSVPCLYTFGEQFEVQSSEPMPDMSWEQAMEFTAKLPPKQTVLGVAIPCQCRRVA
jgi:hypothetical protein